MNKWSLRVATSLLFAGVLSGCVAQVDTLEASPAPSARDAASGYLEAEELRGELRSLIRTVNERHGGRAGISVATGEGVVHAGLTGNSYAWSTIKVPVAMVVDERGAATEELIEASISRSDNDAAYQLFLLLEGDDGSLRHVPALEELPGETKWKLFDQAQFAAQLPCADTAGTTYRMMGEIVDWQQVGLSKLPDAHFKGGWGYDTDTVYTLRQLGTAKVEDGVIGLALITHPDDGSHATAEKILNELGEGLNKLIDAKSLGPAAACRP